MVWQAIVTEVIGDQDATVVRYILTDNQTKKIPKEFRSPSFSLDAFKSLVQSQIDQISSAETENVKISTGILDLTIQPKDPTGREIYSSSLRLLGQINRAILAGAKTDQDSDYVALRKAIHDTFDPSYVDLF